MFSIKVPEGHVCIVSRFKKFNRVLDSGKHTLKPFDVVSKPVSLGPNIMQEWRSATLKDGVTGLYFEHEIKYIITKPYEFVVKYQCGSGSMCVEVEDAIRTYFGECDNLEIAQKKFADYTELQLEDFPEMCEFVKEFGTEILSVRFRIYEGDVEKYECTDSCGITQEDCEDIKPLDEED